MPPRGLISKCSFCGKSQGQVRLIAGPKDVYVCDECIDLGNQILSNRLDGGTESPGLRMQQILIITGPPGAGKTTVARLVATELGENSVCIEADWFWTTIVNGYVEPWKPESQDQNLAVIRAIGACAGALARNGYSVVVEGIVGPWFLRRLVEEIGSPESAINYVVLRPPLEVALDRATSRSPEARVAGHPALTDPDPVTRMWQRFSQLGEHERFVVDNNKITVEDTAQIVIQRLRTGALRLHPVDVGQRMDESYPT